MQPVVERQVALVATIDAQIAEVEAELNCVVQADEQWAASIVRLRTIPGVGLLTAAWLVVATLNFTACPSAEAATALAGLAPQPWQSGTSVRGRARLVHTGVAAPATDAYALLCTWRR
jgi:transposase